MFSGPVSFFSSLDVSPLPGRAPEGSFADSHGRHAVGHVEDFKALQQQLLEGSALLLNMEAALWSLNASQQLHQVGGGRTTCRVLVDPWILFVSVCSGGVNLLRFTPQPPDSGWVRNLLSDSSSLNQVLQEADSLLRRFWRGTLPDSDGPRPVRTGSWSEIKIY